MAKWIIHQMRESKLDWFTVHLNDINCRLEGQGEFIEIDKQTWTWTLRPKKKTKIYKNNKKCFK